MRDAREVKTESGVRQRSPSLGGRRFRTHSYRGRGGGLEVDRSPDCLSRPRPATGWARQGLESPDRIGWIAWERAEAGARAGPRAAGVVVPDIMAREGVHPETPPVPFTPGRDLVGVVDRLGGGVSGIEPGPAYSCCRATIGSMRDARSAGMKHARAATASRIRDTTAPAWAKSGCRS